MYRESEEAELLPAEIPSASGAWYYGGICPNCQADNPVSSKYCGGCGAALDGSMKFCENCDTYCAAESNFCHSCGEKLASEILSYRSGRISGNGREMWAVLLSFILPGYGLLHFGYRFYGLAFFVMAFFLGVWQGVGFYFVFGAISLGTVLLLRD